MSRSHWCQGLFFAFSLQRVLAFCCCSWFSLCRMLLSTGFLYALLMSCFDASSVPVGVREESRCCHFSAGLEGQNALAVIGTRGSSQQVNMMIPKQLLRRRGCRALA